MDIIKAGEPLGARPFFPEPQNDLYWLVQKEGNIKTCNGYLAQNLGADIITRVELDYSVRVHEDGSRQWNLSTTSMYYHPKLSCIQQRCSNFQLSNDVLRIGNDSMLTDDIIC